MPIKPILACCIISFPLVLGGCTRKQQNQTGYGDSAGHPSAMHSSRDVDTAKIKGDALPNNPTEGIVECYGTMVVPASAFVTVAPPSGGILKSVLVPAGSHVQSGSPLAAIENIDFLKLQQEYLEAKSRFSYYSEELKRQGELTIENASSVKKMQLAQMDYEIHEIKLRSLARQLVLTGFTPDSIDVDHLSSLILIRAPVTGFIDKVSVATGNSISPGETLLVIIRDYHPVLVFEIQEKHFRGIKIGQYVDFFLPGDSLIAYKARLSYIYKQIDPVKHAIKARAIPTVQSRSFIPGMHVRVRFDLTKNDTKDRL